MLGIDASTDPRFIDIGELPSRYKPYDYKDLFIRPFTTKELRLLSKAISLNDLNYMVRAVDLVIDKDAKMLTVGDFYYILMWLRLESFPKTPLIVEWTCPTHVHSHLETKDRLRFGDTPEAHEHLVADYELVTCGSTNSELIYNSSLEIIHFDEDFVLPDSRLDYPRAGQLQELTEALANPELKLLAGAAQWIRLPPGVPNTLEERFKLLDESEDLDFFDALSVANECIVHGLSEFTTLKCRSCRGPQAYRLTIEPLSFFR